MPDAVLVPGGGFRENGELLPWVIARLEKALEIADGAKIITLSAGTPHKPRTPVFESVAGAQYLLSRGYPRELILTETASYDTIGNAWFARVMHTDPAGLRDLCVITSDFHMPRTEAIFRWIFGAAPAQPAYRMTFIPTPATGLPADALKSRIGKEQASLAALSPLIHRLKTVAAIHRWLHSEHEIYATGLSSDADYDAGLLQSY
jgi:uncharacterized SAM-binding protein YcdF (DUF218 family)